MKPCEVCDELTEESRCPEHRPPPTPKPARKQAAYDTAWNALSKRARKAQPFCLWCGSTNDLQLDHTPAAWERKLAGKSIRIQDVRVLCGPCNRLAGQARPGPGQRTSEDRPEPVQDLPVSGRLLRTRGDTRKGPSLTPPGRQSLSNTPGTSTEHALSSPW